MTSKQRYLATLRHELPDRMPLDSLGIDDLDAVAQRLACPKDQVMARLGIDVVKVDAEFRGQLQQTSDEGPLSFWGTVREQYSDQRQYPLSGDLSIKQVEQFPWPRTEDFDYSLPARIARKNGDRFAVRGPMWHPLFCQTCDLMGMEEAMMTMIERPSVYEAIVDHIFHFVYDHCRKIVEACGEDLAVFQIADDFATQRGMMIHPELWRRFFKPRYARLLELGKSRGKFTMMHSCGNILEVLPDLIDIGLDVWQTVQLPTLPITAEELKQRFGRHITFFGAISTQRLPFMTADQVRQETVRCIRALGRDGGYIVSADHTLKPDVPTENILALFETAAAFREPGYTL